jgi:opacity protein-like surface antigen
MIKRLVVLCCILLVLTTAASASSEGTTNYGDFWVGGQVGGLFSTETNAAITAGAIAGYNFCMPYRQPWERYFGVALDFQWNQFRPQNFPRGSQFALALLGRLQYPLMGSESFTRGRIVPFLMFGPAIVWTNPNFGDNRTDFGVIAEIGVEFFVCPTVSIGPSYRYMYVGGGTTTAISTDTHHHMVLGRLAYHF